MKIGRTSATRFQRPLVAIAPLLLTLAACGGGRGTAEGGDDDDGGPNRAAAAEGRDIAARSGCAGCHGANGEGGVGPTWIGLAGSQVPLVDGTTVLADQAYLTASIKTPDAQKVTGYAVAMPVNQLSDADIAKIVVYIESLAAGEAPPPPTGATAPTIPVATPAPGATAPPVPVATPAPVTTAAPGG
ncbi:MAG: c-type cytochrome [Ilumatobacteraceae bacterium]